MCWNCGFSSSFSADSAGFGGAGVVFLMTFLTAVLRFVVVFFEAGLADLAGVAADATSTGAAVVAGFFFCELGAGSSSAKNASNKSSPIPVFQIKISVTFHWFKSWFLRFS